MKAIILSAGQGKRLLPMTENRPKCLLPLGAGYNVLSWQLQELERGGFREAVIVTGFEADTVEEQVASYAGSLACRCIYNPFYNMADNLATLWLAVRMTCEEDDDFAVINGDTLFTGAVAERLLQAAPVPVRLTVSGKPFYDADDMKVIRDSGGRLEAVGKSLAPEQVNAESIGFMLFRSSGARALREALDRAARSPGGLERWYLSVINAMAETIRIETLDAGADEWCEIDFPADLRAAAECVVQWTAEDATGLSSESSELKTAAV